MGVAIIVVSVLALVSLALFVIGVTRPSLAARVVPWVGRPSPSRKRAAVVLGAVAVVFLAVDATLLLLPGYSVQLPAETQVVAGESSGVAVAVENSGLLGGTFSAVYALDGVRVSEVVLHVGGSETASVKLPLPADLQAGAHVLTVGDSTLTFRALKPAAFSVTALDSSVDMARTGDEIDVEATVMNTGEVEGEFEGELRVNGRRSDAQPLVISPGAEESLIFSFSRGSQGKYRLQLGEAKHAVVVVKPIKYENGHYLVRKASGGRGVMKVKNGNRTDGVVVLTRTSSRRAPVIACYVRGRQSATITGIPDGKYWVYYTLGRDWNTYTDGFFSTEERGVFSDPCAYSTSSYTTSWSDSMYRYTQGHVRYTNWSITLNPVIGGNARTSSVPQNEFPRAR